MKLADNLKIENCDYHPDGVDIEASDNVEFSNGFNVGWIEDGEWLKYTIIADSTAVYMITLRTAADNAGGRIRFLADDTPVTPSIIVPNSGDWQAWHPLQ